MKWKTLDGNEAVAQVAYRLNELIAIYPITPASAMGEFSDSWASESKPNLWGTIPTVVELQSEAGAAGTLHGALQAGTLATTFTASQGLMLMLPNLYKIAGELTATVIHVAARTLATHALSIFGDHSDVMAARGTGWALLASNTVQEAHDFALLAQSASLQGHLPFLHFFDGFRTSHEVAKIQLLPDEVLRELMDEGAIRDHRERALSPDRPMIRGTAQNPDVFFQGREAGNPYYQALPGILQEKMDRFAALTGRHYQLYQYSGPADADKVFVIMGSGAETVAATLKALPDQKVGLLKVRLFRPLDTARLIHALPGTIKQIIVLDRCKEPGAAGEPLYADLVTAVHEHASHFDDLPQVLGGRYGLASKEFSPAMVKGILDAVNADACPTHFTIGIHDDVSHLSLLWPADFRLSEPGLYQALFYGLGADGTVGANKNSIKLIGEETDHAAQGYFVYDSKKSGAITISHLRFGSQPIEAPYLIEEADFIGCHQPGFVHHFDIGSQLRPGGILLLNSPLPVAEVWASLPGPLQTALWEKQARFYVINASQVAREAGLKGRINTVMQTCFFSLTQVLPLDEALTAIKASIQQSYGKYGPESVRRNLDAIEQALIALQPVPLQAPLAGAPGLLPPVPEQAPAFVREVLGTIIAGKGDQLPVSALPADGTFPSHTSRWEKRALSEDIPVWDEKLCIQCGKCAMVCPHGVIRIKAIPEESLAAAPVGFIHTQAKDRDWSDLRYTIQVSPLDCTGCAICVDVCPARDKSQPRRKALDMQPLAPQRQSQSANWDYFVDLPELDRSRIHPSHIRQQQVQQPLFEFSGACSGCGETPYLKLLSQLFGDHLMIANATGCSSIYGGNLPTTPWASNQQGRGPAWANSLFEDNAEFGYGMRLALDKQSDMAREMLSSQQLDPPLPAKLVEGLLTADQSSESGIEAQRERVGTLKSLLRQAPMDPLRQRLLDAADALVRKSVWIVGGDGWAYDIGFGGLDHVLASGRNIKILVLDTEVYSNTGGQMSKSTPLGAVAKFASGGKPTGKKDLGLMAMSYGHVYVAKVALGAKDDQTLKAFLEAEAYDGPALIIAYSHCIAHGIPMNTALQEHKAAVETGQWELYRYDPRRSDENLPPLQLDSKAPRAPIETYFERQNRFRMLRQSHPQLARKLAARAQQVGRDRYAYYQQMATGDQAKNLKGTPAHE